MTRRDEQKRHRPERNYAKWDYGTLKRKSGLKDKELGAALGWLACEDKIVLHQENEELYIFLGVNVYIG